MKNDLRYGNMSARYVVRAQLCVHQPRQLMLEQPRTTSILKRCRWMCTLHEDTCSERDTKICLHRPSAKTFEQDTNMEVSERKEFIDLRKPQTNAQMIINTDQHCQVLLVHKASNSRSRSRPAFPDRALEVEIMTMAKLRQGRLS